MRDKIIVLIITYNGEHWIKKTLQCILNSSVSLSTLIIDNGSTDNTKAIVENNFPEVKLFTNKENLGFGKANNQGIEIALEMNFDYIFLINQDVYVYDDTLNSLIEVQKANPQFGLVSPLHLNGKGSDLDNNFAKCIPYNSYSKLKTAIDSGVAISPSNFINAAAWLLTKDTILKTGGFDPIFSHYGEDNDYCNRLRFNKIKLGISLKSKICHDRIYSSANTFRKTQNSLFSAGLVHLKNINNSLALNILTWLFSRFKKSVKYILRLDFRTLQIELSVIKKLYLVLNEIKKSRNESRNSACFLSLNSNQLA